MPLISYGHVRQTGVGRQPGLLMALVLLLCSAIVLRLAWLQLLHGQEHRAMADENRIRLIPRDPVRGRLLDHTGQVLATNRLTYRLYYQPRLTQERLWPSLRDRLSGLLGIPAEQLELQRRLHQGMTMVSMCP